MVMDVTVAHGAVGNSLIDGETYADGIGMEGSVEVRDSENLSDVDVIDVVDVTVGGGVFIIPSASDRSFEITEWLSARYTGLQGELN